MCIAQGHNIRTCQLISTLTLFYAERQEGNCEYQLLKSFGLIRPGNRTLVYRLRGEHSNHEPHTTTEGILRPGERNILAHPTNKNDRI